METEIFHAVLPACRAKNSRPRNFFFALLPLRHREDLRTLGFLLLLLALFFIQWTGLHRDWYLLPATCVLAFVACIIKHNHIHNSTFTSRGWNRAFELLLGLCTGQSTAAIIPVHNERHHAQNNTEEDYVRSTLVAYRWNWLNFLVFPFAVVLLVHRNKQRDIARWRSEKPALYRRIQMERLAVMIPTLLLLVFNWKATLVYIGLPWIAGQWGIITINLLQHQDCEHSSSHNHSRNITGRLVNWLFLNNGFHAAHHIRPALHWSRLPEFHREHVVRHAREDLNDRSLLMAVWRRFFTERKSFEP